MAAMKILLATPAYGSTVTTNYLESVIKLIQHFAEHHPQVTIEIKTLSTAVLSFSRNCFASIVLNDESYSHLFFVDADMGFEPNILEAMLEFNKPVTSCICPQKTFDLERFYEIRQQVDHPLLARLIAQEYVSVGGHLWFANEKKKGDLVSAADLSFENGFVRVHQAGTGIMLIQREALIKMKDAFPALYVEHAGDHYASYGVRGGVLQCFESLQAETGFYVSEDTAFCLRWTHECGGEIWAYTEAPIAHVGQMTYLGHYATKAGAGLI